MSRFLSISKGPAESDRGGGMESLTGPTYPPADS